MSGDADDWADVMRAVAAIVDERPAEYAPAVRQCLEDLLLLLRSTNRPAPSVSPGYWPTFCLTWKTEEARNLQIEVFEDRYEVYRFFDGKTDIWYEPHLGGEGLSDAFIAELPQAA
jgi:hypothetical protein